MKIKLLFSKKEAKCFIKILPEEKSEAGDEVELNPGRSADGSFPDGKFHRLNSLNLSTAAAHLQATLQPSSVQLFLFMLCLTFH